MSQDSTKGVPFVASNPSDPRLPPHLRGAPVQHSARVETANGSSFRVSTNEAGGTSFVATTQQNGVERTVFLHNNPNGTVSSGMFINPETENNLVHLEVSPELARQVRDAIRGAARDGVLSPAEINTIGRLTSQAFSTAEEVDVPSWAR